MTKLASARRDAARPRALCLVGRLGSSRRSLARRDRGAVRFAEKQTFSSEKCTAAERRGMRVVMTRGMGEVEGN